MADIHAIETEYNGMLFRSRTEARWAVFFDACEIKYEYEPEGFYNSRFEEHYLPDFYLPDYDIYVEVKPIRPKAESELERAVRFVSCGIIHRLLVLPAIPKVCKQGDGYWFAMFHTDLGSIAKFNVFVRMVTFAKLENTKTIVLTDSSINEARTELDKSLRCGVSYVDAVTPTLDSAISYTSLSDRFFRKYRWCWEEFKIAREARFGLEESDLIDIIEARNFDRHKENDPVKSAEWFALSVIVDYLPSVAGLLDYFSAYDFTDEQYRNVFLSLKDDLGDAYIKYLARTFHYVDCAKNMVLMHAMIGLKENTVKRAEAEMKAHKNDVDSKERYEREYQILQMMIAFRNKKERR